MFCEPLESRRMLTAGALDTTFGDSGFTRVPPVDGMDGLFRTFAASKQGSIAMAAGYSDAGAGFGALHRYTADGELDEAFGQDGTLDLRDINLHGLENSVRMDDAGRIYVLNRFDEFTITRLNGDGKVDSRWANNGMASLPPGFFPDDFMVLDDGSLAMAGLFNPDQSNNIRNPLAAIFKLLPDGGRDGRFDQNPRGINGLVALNLVPEGTPSDDTRSSSFIVVREAPDGTLVAAGVFEAVGVNPNNPNNPFVAKSTVVARFSSRGQLLDSNHDFGASALSQESLTMMEVDPFGRIYLVDVTERTLHRLTPNLQIDPWFGRSGSVTSSRILDIEIQSDASILLSADFGLPGHHTKPFGGIRRYRSNGALDRSFGTNTWAYSQDRLAFSQVQMAIDGSILGIGSEQLSRFWRSDGPTGSIQAPPISVQSASPQRITVRWRDDVTIDPSTIDSNDLVIVSPGGGLFSTQLIGSTTSNGVIAANYDLAPTGGRWDRSDNGIWTIRVNPNQVADLDGNFLIKRPLGTFLVDIL